MAWGGDSLADLSKTLDGILTKERQAQGQDQPKSAIAEGQEVTFEQAKTMPTRTEAIGTILGMILSPGAQIAGQIIGPAAPDRRAESRRSARRSPKRRRARRGARDAAGLNRTSPV